MYPLSVQESQDTKLGLEPWSTVGVARATECGLFLQYSLKSVAGGTIDGMDLHFSNILFNIPVVS